MGERHLFSTYAATWQVSNVYSSSMLTVLVLTLPHFCQWGWLYRAAHARAQGLISRVLQLVAGRDSSPAFMISVAALPFAWALMDREVGKGISPLPMLTHDRWVMGTILPHSQLQTGSATPLPTELALLNFFFVYSNLDISMLLGFMQIPAFWPLGYTNFVL